MSTNELIKQIIGNKKMQIFKSIEVRLKLIHLEADNKNEFKNI